jgi:hypothetical protein
MGGVEPFRCIAAQARPYLTANVEPTRDSRAGYHGRISDEDVNGGLDHVAPVCQPGIEVSWCVARNQLEARRALDPVVVLLDLGDPIVDVDSRPARRWVGQYGVAPPERQTGR